MCTAHIIVFCPYWVSYPVTFSVICFLSSSWTSFNLFPPYVNLVDFVKSFLTSIYLEKSASIQPRTSFSNLGGDSIYFFNSLLSWHPCSFLASSRGATPARTQPQNCATRTEDEKRKPCYNFLLLVNTSQLLFEAGSVDGNTSGGTRS